MKKIALLLCVSLLATLCFGCGGNGGSKEVTLYVLNWGDYIDETMLTRFEKENPGIKVHYDTVASNEEMLTKLSAPDSIYDICFPSDYIIEKMAREDMLHPINKANIPNIKNIDERFLNRSFDPGNKYSVPYMWGTVGLLYNTTKVEGPVTSWRILWDKKYSGQIYMYDSIRDTIGATLKMLGHSINTRDEAHILEAQQALIEQKPLVKAYLDDPIKENMINGNGALAIVYSGDATWCIAENPDLAYVVPDEGSNIWFDNVIIPKKSAHTAEAEKFINFLCEADVAKANTEYIGYSSPNKAAREMLDADLLADETYNPPQAVIDRCEVFSDLGDFLPVYNRAWQHIKSA